MADAVKAISIASSDDENASTGTYVTHDGTEDLIMRVEAEERKYVVPKLQQPEQAANTVGYWHYNLRAK